MSSVGVFDSGLGSLSIVNAIRQISKCDIVYYADTKNHPYGTKSPQDLCDITRKTIQGIRELFAPSIVVVGSNTPTLLCDIEDNDTVGVWPPIMEASRLSCDDTVTVLATSVVVQHDYIERYAKSLNLSVHIKKVNASGLVHLVESGTFLNDHDTTYNTIEETLHDIQGVCTLSSTHLLFLQSMMEEVRPDITFVDPASMVARRVANKIKNTGKGRLSIYTSGGHDITPHLRQLGITEDVNLLKPFYTHD